MKNLYSFFLSLLIFLGISFSPLPAHASTGSPRIFVANIGGTSVSVIDSGTNNVIETIPLIAHPHYLTLSPDGTKLYVDVTDFTNGTLQVFDTTTYNDVADISIGNNPGDLRVTPDGTRLYLIDYPNITRVIDTATNSMITSISTPYGTDMTMSGDGTRVYVSSSATNSVYVIDTTNNTLLTTLTVAPGVSGAGASGMAVIPDGSRLYVTGGAVTVIDTATYATLAIIQTNADRVAVNSTGTRAYVSNGLDNSVSVIDTATNSILTTIPLSSGAGPNGLVLLPDDTHVYVSNSGGQQVSIIDTSSNTVVGNVTVGNNPFSIVIEKRPSVHTITAPSSPVQVNTAITASATFAEPGIAGTHTASWNWGDGNTTSGTVTEANSLGSVSDTHTYTATGVYTITLTVTDQYGGVGTSTYQYVAVYDSTTSFAGGRSFDNPSSASPNTTGKVSFGISSKYNNSNVLTGSVKMNFKAASIDFASTSLSSLATSTGKAYLKGSGTLNGNSGYTFLATGIDGSVVGGNDLIRFQIKDASNNVIYDSQPGAGDTTDPTTLDATGNIRVH